MEKEKQTKIENHVFAILKLIGEDPTRPGLVDTPKRIARMYNELFRGYDEKQKPNITVFDNGADGITCDQMITDTGNYYSHCEHHMVPFFGNYYFAYIPSEKGKILGLSKVTRIIDHFAAKMQVQERLVQEIVEELWKALTQVQTPIGKMNKYDAPLGMALIMKGTHLCKSMRGVKKEGIMTTSCMKGVFKTKPEARAEFMSLIQ